MLASYMRRLRAMLMQATSVLPTLGFGRPKEPPTEPIQRSEVSTAPPGAGPELHDQQHVNPGRRIEIDKSTE